MVGFAAASAKFSFLGALRHDDKVSGALGDSLKALKPPDSLMAN